MRSRIKPANQTNKQPFISLLMFQSALLIKMGLNIKGTGKAPKNCVLTKESKSADSVVLDLIVNIQKCYSSPLW